ncbi:hypothetical protein L484_009844 [Morus notabilis]|uniref:Leucine-rich repeat-containing N-terminal plant-type domain-containing protein n=1 Tax=Morus notabilis TaxID=981085 RepID=W9R769_9ROSA|nr:hypothetical protein L484_009844 [Morus notabilis]
MVWPDFEGERKAREKNEAYPMVLATTQIHTLSDDDQVRCLETERLVLLTFKQGLVDPGKSLSSWTNSSNRDCCTWTGITCDNRTNHVVVLALGGPYKRIGGDIGASLVKLQYLEVLDFSGNDFTRIPKFIGSFKRLTYLSLRWNPMWRPSYEAATVT